MIQMACLDERFSAVRFEDLLNLYRNKYLWQTCQVDEIFGSRDEI